MLQYESVVRAEAVEGDGRSKVGSFLLVLGQLLNIAEICRTNSVLASDGQVPRRRSNAGGSQPKVC